MRRPIFQQKKGCPNIRTALFALQRRHRSDRRTPAALRSSPLTEYVAQNTSRRKPPAENTRRSPRTKTFATGPAPHSPPPRSCGRTGSDSTAAERIAETDSTAAPQLQNTQPRPSPQPQNAPPGPTPCARSRPHTPQSGSVHSFPAPGNRTKKAAPAGDTLRRRRPTFHLRTTPVRHPIVASHTLSESSRPSPSLRPRKTPDSPDPLPG